MKVDIEARTPVSTEVVAQESVNDLIETDDIAEENFEFFGAFEMDEDLFA